MSSISIAIAVLLWAVALLQLPSAVQQPWKRVPFLIFAALALDLTVDLPAVIPAVDHAAGVTDLSELIREVAAAVAFTAALEWVVTLNHPQLAPRRPGWRHGLAGTVIAALVILFFLTPRHETTEFAATETSGTATAFKLVLDAYLTPVMTVTARLYWRASRSTSPGLFRAGLQFLTAGWAVGAGSGLYNITFLAARASGARFPGGTSRAVSVSVSWEDLAVGLLITGMLIPPAAEGFRLARHLASFHALYPLWHRLVTTAPDIALDPRGRHRIRMPRHLRVQTIRRIAEIRDGLLLLRPYVTPETVRQARVMLAGHGLEGARLDAAVEACTLELALRARHRGARPLSTHDQPVAGGSSLEEEIAWLRMAAAARNSPAVRLVTDALDPAG